MDWLAREREVRLLLFSREDFIRIQRKLKLKAILGDRLTKPFVFEMKATEIQRN